MDGLTIVIGIIALLVGAAIGYFLSKKSVDKENQLLIDQAKNQAETIIKGAQKEGEDIKK